MSEAHCIGTAIQGCRLDTESFTYAYFFLNDIVPD